MHVYGVFLKEHVMLLPCLHLLCGLVSHMMHQFALLTGGEQALEDRLEV